MKFLNHIIQAALFALCVFIPTVGQAKGNHPSGIFKDETFKHNIQLQLSDAYGVPVPGTEFWVTLTILKKGQQVTVQIPSINFVTGPLANASYEKPFLPPPIEGGYLYTADGFLPKNLRPNDVVYRSWLGASNNGLSLPFSFGQPNNFPIPPVGYIVSITNAGALVIQGAGTFCNIIPPGQQILLPTDVTYLVLSKEELRKNQLKGNTVLSTGPTDTTQFTGGDTGAAGTELRDSHVNDAFDGTVAWAWTDNSMIADKTNNTLNAMVAIGRTTKEGKLKVRAPIQITDLPPGTFAWDTAVAINRNNKDNIVVSYAINNAPSAPFIAVSFDGGKTWPHNGPIVLDGGDAPLAGDNRGVSSDKFGNIWYSSTNLDNLGQGANVPYFAVSVDGGLTFQTIFSLPAPPANFLYDYPQYCFGGNGKGKYGLHYTTDYANLTTGDLAPLIGFIPIKGLGSFKTPSTPILLSAFLNNNQTPSITASSDGRVWYLGTPSGLGPGELPNPGTAISTIRTIFKSPGPLDKNYAGPWDFTYLNLLNEFFFAPTEKSQPFFGFLHNSIQSNLYDDARQALYGIVSAQNPDFSQNMRLYFRISRDNGQTWSNAMDISNSQKGNRGFQSMALDPVTGDLYFGWYDGRGDPSFKSLEYFGAVIPAKQLDKLVNDIPLSNPLYQLPSAGNPL